MDVLERNRWLQALVILATLIAGFFFIGLIWQLGVRFSDVILPFFLAWLLAFMLNPLADALVVRRIPRPLAIALVYVAVLIVIIGAGLVIVPPVAEQSVQFGRQFPAYVGQIPILLDGLERLLNDRGLNVTVGSLLGEASLVQRAEALGSALATNALGIAGGVASVIFNAIIVVILSFYFMIDGARIGSLLLEVMPTRWAGPAAFFVDSVNRTFGGFMRGLLIQSVVYGVGTGLIMALAGLPYAGVIAVFAGIIMVIPFVGSFVALIPPLLLAALTFDWLKLLLVFIGLMLLQQLVLNVITPKVMSDNVGMHPLLIFAAVLLGAKEAGAWGAIFGVPFAGVLWSMVVLFYRQRRKSKLIVPTSPLVTSDDRPIATAVSQGGMV